MRGSRMILILLLLAKTVNGQFSGRPLMRTFDKREYKSGSSNWDIAQDSRGIMYFANNDGLLSFDGFIWKTIPLPNRTTARSLAIDDEGRIYTGGQNEIGYFFPDEKGNLVYHSLLDRIDSLYRTFTDVWQIEILDNTVYWRAMGRIYAYDGSVVDIIDNRDYPFIARHNNRIFLQSLDGDAYFMDGQEVRELAGSPLLDGTLITELISVSDSMAIICTEKNGLYRLENDSISPWNAELNKALENDLIYDGLALSDGRIAIGTTFSGIAITDSTGQLLYMIDREMGLRLNQIVCLEEDEAGNLWAGHTNGISMISIQSPFSYFLPDGNLEGGGYETMIYKGDLYFATSNGLYYKDLNNRNISQSCQQIPGTNGQTWGLDIVNDQLILAHNTGAFHIKDHQSEKFFADHGTWLFQEDRARKGKWIAGTYYGIYQFEGGDLPAPEDRIREMQESARFVCQDEDGTIWISHPYRGIYRIKRDDNGNAIYRLFGKESGLPSGNHNHIFNIKGEMIVCAEKGIYTFDTERELFLLDSAWYKLFDPDVKVRRLFESPEGDIWFVTDSEIGYYKMHEKGLDVEYEKISFPQLYPMLNGGFEHIYPYDANNVFIGTASGFIHYDQSHHSQDTGVFHLILKEVRAGSKYDKLIFGGHFVNDGRISLEPSANEIQDIAFRDNSIKFEVTATDYAYPGSLKFRWKLEGLEQQWSNWEDLRFKEYTQLGPGKYVLKVQCRGAGGSVKEIHYSFKLATPWYRSLLVQILALVLLISSMGYYILRSEKKIDAMEIEVEKTVKESKKKTELLEKEKMQAELDHKQRELISSTIHLANLQENYSSIRERLQAILSEVRNPEVKKEVNKILKKIDIDKNMEDHWENILLHFNELHGGLINRLRNDFPELSAKDLKLCTYLRMNLSSKEIASLMNVSTRGVEASRYRLRKKLNLDKDDNLVEFFMNY